VLPMAHTSDGRSGKVVCHRAGERWTVELRLDEDGGGKGRQHVVFLGRAFATETTASRAGELAVAEWEGGRVAARDLMLGELAATYRKLRENHQRMDPPLVPTTRSSWEHAITAWEGLGWINAGDATRLREHVRWALAPGAGGISERRIRLGESDPTP
jgi:hypothetical protein